MKIRKFLTAECCVILIHTFITCRLLDYCCVRRRRTHTNHVVFRNQSRGFYNEEGDAIRFQGFDAILGGGWTGYVALTDNLDRIW